MRTSETVEDAPGSKPRLKREIGLWMAVALVVGNMVGSGIFLLPASLASAAGPVSIIGWIFTGVGAMLPALVFARHRGDHNRRVRARTGARGTALHVVSDRARRAGPRVGA